MKFPVSLQINVAPVDMAFLAPIMAHQLSIFGNLCEEIVVTVETKKSENSRWSSSDWDTNLTSLLLLLEEMQVSYPHLLISKIDYSSATHKKASDFFMESSELLPWKDFRGGPYYSYYYGVFSCSQKYVLHMDSDMLYCGSAEAWLREALAMMEEDKEVLLCSPLVGPPVRKGEEVPIAHKKRYNPIGNYQSRDFYYKYKDISTRIYLIEKERLHGFAITTRPNLDQWIKAIWRGLPCYHTPERSLSVAMQKRNLFRLDFLGEDGGFWSYHPPAKKSENFLNMLPHVISEIERGFFTEAQRGRQQFTTSLLEALEESFRQSKS